jgi:hypothetical protein
METEVHCNSGPLNSVLRQLYQVCTRTISHIRLGLSGGLFRSGFQKISNAYLIPLVRIICPAHFIILNLVIHIKYGKEYRL